MSTNERALGERVAALEARADSHEADLRELYRDIHGPPRDESIRGRLHILENDTAAARAAHAALETAQALRDTQGTRSFSRFEKTLGLIFAGMLTASSITGLILTVIHYT